MPAVCRIDPASGKVQYGVVEKVFASALTAAIIALISAVIMNWGENRSQDATLSAFSVLVASGGEANKAEHLQFDAEITKLRTELVQAQISLGKATEALEFMKKEHGRYELSFQRMAERLDKISSPN